MRLAYIDEAGISSREQEPILVVAAIIIDADRQLVALERHLDRLIEKYIPEPDRLGFVFHATELFSGGRYFARDKWSFETRLEILDKLVRIPSHFNLPISIARLDRTSFKTNHFDPPLNEFGVQALEQASAFLNCAMGVEVYMRAMADKEIAMIIAEDAPKVKEGIKIMHKVLSSGSMMNAAGIGGEENGPFARLLPFERIRDTVHFAGKRESKCLQIADLVAFAVKRHAMRKEHSDRLFEPLRSQICWPPAPEGEQSS